MTKIGLGMAFLTQTKSKLQYTKSSPDFSLGVTLKYVWGFKPPEMAWQQIVGNAIKRMQQLMWKGTKAYVINLRFKGKSSIL